MESSYANFDLVVVVINHFNEMLASSSKSKEGSFYCRSAGFSQNRNGWTLGSKSLLGRAISSTWGGGIGASWFLEEDGEKRYDVCLKNEGTFKKTVFFYPGSVWSICYLLELFGSSVWCGLGNAWFSHRSTDLNKSIMYCFPYMKLFEFNTSWYTLVRIGQMVSPCNFNELIS